MVLKRDSPGTVEDVVAIPTASVVTSALITGGVGKICDFQPIRYLAVAQKRYKIGT